MLSLEAIMDIQLELHGAVVATEILELMYSARKVNNGLRIISMINVTKNQLRSKKTMKKYLK